MKRHSFLAVAALILGMHSSGWASADLSAAPGSIPPCRLNDADSAAVEQTFKLVLDAWNKSNPAVKAPFDGVAVNKDESSDRTLLTRLVNDSVKLSAGEDQCHWTRPRLAASKGFETVSPSEPDDLTVRQVCKPFGKHELRCSAQAIHALLKQERDNPHPLSGGVKPPHLALALLLAHEISHFAHRDAGAAYLPNTAEVDLQMPLEARERTLRVACIGTLNSAQVEHEARADREAVTVVQTLLATIMDAEAARAQKTLVEANATQRQARAELVEKYDQQLIGTVPDPQKRKMLVASYERILNGYQQINDLSHQQGIKTAREVVHYVAFADLEIALINLRYWDAAWRGQQDLFSFDRPVPGDEQEAFTAWAVRRRICDVRAGGTGAVVIPRTSGDHPSGPDRVAQLSSKLMRLTAPASAKDTPGPFHSVAAGMATEDDFTADMDGRFAEKFCDQIAAPPLDCSEVPRHFPNEKCDRLMAPKKNANLPLDAERMMRLITCSGKIPLEAMDRARPWD